MRTIPAFLLAALLALAAPAARAQTISGPASAAPTVPFVATGGSSADTLANRAGDELNLKRDFGAKGDGSTDDTVALQNFLNACAAGRACFAPAGTYTFTSLTLDTTATSAGMVIRGSGAGLTIFKRLPGQTGHALTITAGANYGNMARPVIRDLTINGNFSGQDAIHFADRPNTGYYQAADLFNVTSLDAGQDALYIGANANAGQTYNFWAAHPNRNGVTINNAADWRIVNSQIYGADQAGLAVAGMADNGSGLIRVTTATAHGLSTGATVFLWDVPTAATGKWTVTVIDSTHVDLQGSSSAGLVYAGYGRFVPQFTITGTADYGDAGHSIEVTTSTAHGYSTGQQVFIKDVAGAYMANGGWTITVVDSTHFVLNGSSVNSQTYTSGGTVVAAAFGVYSNATAANMLIDDTEWTSQVGIVLTSGSSSFFKVSGGEFGGNWMGGIAFQRQGLTVPDVINNVAFNNNSGAASGLFSDILLVNANATQITNNQFQLGTLPVHYLVEAQNIGTYGLVWSGNSFRNDGTSQPFSTSITNQNAIGIPNGKQGAFVAGNGSYSGSTASMALGYKVNSTGAGGLATGESSSDGGRKSAVYGIHPAVHAGGNQSLMAEVLGGETTNATALRLTTDWFAANTASPTQWDTFNFIQNIGYGTVMLRGCVAIAQQQGSANRVVWVLPDILMAKDGSNSAVSILSGTGLLTPGAQTATYASASLSSVTLSIIADTTNGGLSVTGTGIASTTLDWHMSCRGAEIE